MKNPKLHCLYNLPRKTTLIDALQSVYRDAELGNSELIASRRRQHANMGGTRTDVVVRPTALGVSYDHTPASVRSWGVVAKPE